MLDDRIFQLPTREIPKKWLNVQSFLPEPVPPMLSPADGSPVPLEAFTPLFPMGLLEQEVSTAREITIPDEVLKVYSMFRPTPLIRAKFLEEALGTPAIIFFKNESVTPTGSHKPNTAIPQAYYNMKEGVKKLSTETGAGQWGSALAFAGAHFNLDINVFMVRASYEQKPYRKVVMQSYGARVHPSPSTGNPDRQEDARGQAQLPRLPGNRHQRGGGDRRHLRRIGQVLPGLRAQPRADAPDGDRPGGARRARRPGADARHRHRLSRRRKQFRRDHDPLPGGQDHRARGRSSSSPPSRSPVHRSARVSTPTISEIRESSFRWPRCTPWATGSSRPRCTPAACATTVRRPSCPLLNSKGLIRAEALRQKETFEAAVLFARTEGIIPAPESAHAIASAIRAAKKCKETGEKKVILFNLSGHGHFDMYAYEQYFNGKLEDYEYPEAGRS